MSATLQVKLAVLASVAIVVALFVVPIASAHTPSIDASISCDGLLSYTVTGTNASGRSLDNPDIGVYVDGIKVFDGAFTDLNGREFTGTYQITDFSSATFTVSTKALGSWGDRSPGGETDSTTVSHSPNCDSLSTGATGTTIGGTIHDVATLSHAAAATGTVTFKVFSTSDCSGTPLATFGNVAASPSSGNGDGTWTFTSGNYPTTAAGTFTWTASFAGDSHNSSISEGCGGANETSTVAKASPTITTNASPLTQTIAGSGLDLTDTATLAGGASPTGTITFQLVTDASGACGTQVGSVTAPVSGNGSYTSPSVRVSSAGLYHWVASYGGDGNNNVVSGACGDTNESVTVMKAAPTISTNAAPLSLTLASAGLDLSDKATLAAGASPTGTITFGLFTDSSGACGAQVGSPVTVPVNGNGTYTSPTVHVGAAGTYHWIASYGGDASNNAVSGACGDPNESVTVSTPPPSGTPAISITKSPKSQTITSGATANFTITVTNTGTLALSNVTVSDPLSPNCNETSAIPALARWLGASVTYSCSLANVTASFTNVATATGTGSNGQTVTATDSRTVTVTRRLRRHRLRIPRSGSSRTRSRRRSAQGGTATFTITVTNTGDVTLSDVTVTDPLSPELRPQPRHPRGRPVEALHMHEGERERRLRQRRDRDREAADDRGGQGDGSGPHHGEAVHPAAASEDRDRQEPEDPDARDHAEDGEDRGREQDDRDLRHGALHDQGHEHRRRHPPQRQRHRPGLARLRQDHRDARLARLEDLHLHPLHGEGELQERRHRPRHLAQGRQGRGHRTTQA